MVAIKREGESYRLSRQDLRILTALLASPMNGYQLARQCEDDAGELHGDVSIGGVQYALKRLVKFKFVAQAKDEQSRSGYVYKITPTGRTILDWEMVTLKHLLDLAAKRF